MINSSRPLTLTTLLLAVFTGCTGVTAESTAPAAADMQPAGQASAPAGEQLIAQPPAGWQQVGATSIAGLRRTEFVPQGEDQQDWRKRITFEAIADKPLPDPIEFVALITSDRNRLCGTFESYPTFAGFENGYSTAVHLLICHEDRNTKQSEVTLMKTIRGNDFFYVITRAGRGPPISGEEPAMEESVIGAWSLYLRSISVCDDARPAHPCPAPGARN